MQPLQGVNQTTAQAVAAQVQQTMRSNDVSVRTFSKPRVPDGSDAAWPQWSWHMEAAATHLGMEDVFQMGRDCPTWTSTSASMPRSCMGFLWRTAKAKLQQSCRHVREGMALNSLMVETEGGVGRHSGSALPRHIDSLDEPTMGRRDAERNQRLRQMSS